MEATTYKDLSEVPEDVHEVYSMKGPYTPIYGNLEWGILCLQNHIPVAVHVRHHKRGWEQV